MTGSIEMVALVQHRAGKRTIADPQRIGTVRIALLFELAMALTAIAATVASEFSSADDTQMHMLGIGCLIAICVVAVATLRHEGMRGHRTAVGETEELPKEEGVQAANFARGRFLASISHEIRAPLNAIYGYAQLLERDNRVPPREAAQVICRCAEHLTSLVDHLLDISQLDNGVMRVKHDTVRFRDFLDQIFWMLLPGAQSKGLEFRVLYPERMPEYVRLDESRLRQALINLLSNAIKFTETGSVLFKVGYAAQIATFEVIDTGSGISEEDRTRIFDPFERGGQGGQQGQPGMGLGLPITQAIVQILGGNLSLESQPGKGSRFKVTLMLGDVAGKITESSAARNIVGYEGRRRSILIVDDDSRQLSFLRTLFESLGFSVTALPNGENAVALCAGGEFDLAMLDINLPGETGWAIAAALRERMGLKLHIVMLSANVQKFHKPETQAVVHDLFLVKPIQVEALLEALGGLLDLTWKSGAPAREIPIRSRPTRAYDLSEAGLLHVQRLRDLLRIGHIRGVEAEIAALDASAPTARDLIAQLYDCLDRYDLTAMMRKLEDV